VLILLQHVIVVLLVDVVLFHLFELIGVCRANKVALHIIYVSLGVHEVLLVFPLDLYPAHHHVVLDVYALLLFLVPSPLLLVALRQEPLLDAMILRLLTICVHIIVKHLLRILLLHGPSNPATDGHQVVVLIVIALRLIVLHLEQVIVLLLRIAILGVRDHSLSLCGLLLLLLYHVEALALGARGLKGRQLVHRTSHIVLHWVVLLLLVGEGGVLLLSGEFRLLLPSHLRGVVTMNNGILLEVEQVVILFGVN